MVSGKVFILTNVYKGYQSRKARETEFPLAPMGVLAPGSAHAPLGPPSTLAEIFRRTCLGGGVKLSESFSDQLSRQIREF